jgi:hypothetical protein
LELAQFGGALHRIKRIKTLLSSQKFVKGSLSAGRKSPFRMCMENELAVKRTDQIDGEDAS